MMLTRGLNATFQTALVLLGMLSGASLTLAQTSEPGTKPGCSRPILVAASELGKAMTIAADGSISGPTKGFFDAVARDSGCVFEYVVVPRARAFYMLEHGDVDIVGDAIRTTQRDRFANFIPAGSVTAALLTANRKLDVDSTAKIADSSLTLATVLGFDYGPTYRALLADPKMKGRISELRSPDGAAKMLLAGRVDAVLMSPTIFFEPWERLTGGEFTINPLSDIPTTEYGVYLTSTRMTPADMKTVDNALNAAISRKELQAQLKGYYPKWIIEHLKPLAKAMK